MHITGVRLTYWLAFMAFLSSLSSAGIMTEVLSPRGAGLLIAIVGALQSATAVVVGKAEDLRTHHAAEEERGD